MAYRVTHADERGVRLRRTRGSYWLVALGLSFSAVLAVLTFWPWPGKQRLHAVLIGTGALAIGTIPALIVRRRLRLDPHEIVFDNEQAVVAVVDRGATGSARGGVRGFIPYQDLRGFVVRGESRGERSSEGSVSDHEVFLSCFERQDGARWDLADFGSVEEAEGLRNVLRKHVRLDRRSQGAAAPTLPARVAAELSPSSVSISWRNRFDAATAGIEVVLLACYFAVFAAVAQTDVRATGAVATSTWVLIGLGAGMAVLLSWLKWRSARVSHCITIDRDQVEVVRRFGAPRSPGSPDDESRVVERAATPLRQVVGVRLEFTTQTGPAPLRLWTAAEADAEERLAEASMSFDRIQQLFGAALRPEAIDVGALTTAERLNLENYLNRVLRVRFREGWQSMLRDGERAFAGQHFFWEER